MRTGTLRWFAQSVTIYPFAASDGFGASTFGAGVIVAARVQLSDKALLDDKGNTIISSCQVYVDGNTVVNSSSKIVLPDGSTPHILSVRDKYAGTDIPYMRVIYT